MHAHSLVPTYMLIIMNTPPFLPDMSLTYESSVCEHVCVNVCVRVCVCKQCDTWSNSTLYAHTCTMHVCNGCTWLLSVSHHELAQMYHISCTNALLFACLQTGPMHIGIFWTVMQCIHRGTGSNAFSMISHLWLTGSGGWPRSKSISSISSLLYVLVY